MQGSKRCFENFFGHPDCITLSHRCVLVGKSFAEKCKKTVIDRFDHGLEPYLFASYPMYQV